MKTGKLTWVEECYTDVEYKEIGKVIDEIESKREPGNASDIIIEKELGGLYTISIKTFADATWDEDPDEKLSEDEFVKDFVNTIKTRLDEIGMTQRELAEKVGVTEVSMSRYLHGDRLPNVYRGQKIVNVLGLKGWNE